MKFNQWKYPAPYIGLSFDSTVELTETKFRNNFVTLLTGLGGSVKQLNDQFKHLSIKFIFWFKNPHQVSTGRTLLWICVLVLSTLKVCSLKEKNSIQILILPWVSFVSALVPPWRMGLFLNGVFTRSRGKGSVDKIMGNNDKIPSFYRHLKSILKVLINLKMKRYLNWLNWILRNPTYTVLSENN